MQDDKTTDKEFEYYLEKMCSTRSEDAFFSLLHLGERYIPSLIAAYQNEKNPSVQALLVEIVWQHRSIKALSFLGDVLHNPHSEVWQCALDGFAALPNVFSLDLLQEERQRFLDPLNDKNNCKQATEHVKWIDEIIDKIKQELQK